MQHRRDTHGLAYFSQTCTAVNRCGFRCQQSFRGAGNGVTPGGYDDNVVFDQFFDHGNAAVIMFLPGIIASDHTRAAANPTVDDVIV